jgi:hypothetical protein
MKPTLFLDVDGVISREDDRAPNGYITLSSGQIKPVSFSHKIGLRLRRLMEEFEIVWATAWEEDERDPLLDLLGIEQRFPSIDYRTHKLLCVLQYVADHKIERWVWIDDYSTMELVEVAVAPHLLSGLIIAPLRSIGLEDRHVDAALEWVARQGRNEHE